MSYSLSDEVIAAIAQSVQLAMLTGTDVVDHLRLLEVEVSDELGVAGISQLKLTASCVERLERNVEDLTRRALELRQLSSESEKTK
jgi:hypothetical protein